MTTLVWPARTAISFGEAPAAIQSATAVWRRSWGRSGSRPAARTAGVQKRRRQISRRHDHGRNASIVVVAEGATPTRGPEPSRSTRVDPWGRPRPTGVGELVGRLLEQLTGFETRTTVLGHIQRGGSPTASDRLVASRLGAAAAQTLADGTSGRLVGINGTATSLVPLNEVAGKTRLPPPQMIELLSPMTTAGAFLATVAPLRD